MPLFQLGDFLLASGQRSDYKIECDALTDSDWAALAKMAADILPPFCHVEGVPRGGMKFAAALMQYAKTNTTFPVLIAEDVCTTGGSIERYRKHLENVFGTPAGGFIGVCAFGRGGLPQWVRSLWSKS